MVYPVTDEDWAGLYGLGQPPQPLVKPAPLVKPFAPQVITPQVKPFGIAPPLPQPAIIPAPPKEEKPLGFWERALQVFSAPFVWVDENIIKPGFGVIGTTMGFVPELERMEGEDYWEWKKRSWAGWETPGITWNVPWDDEPWRIDFKGVMELAPWLLLPAVGQVGRGAKAGVGLAGFLGKGEKLGRAVGGIAEVVPGVSKLGLPSKLGEVTGVAGKGLGYAIQYSPWGFAERATGKAIKGGIKTVGFISSRISTKVAEKLWGKIPEPPPPSSAVVKLTKDMEEVIGPAWKEFREEKPELYARMRETFDKYNTLYREGKISTWEEASIRAKAELKGKGLKENEFLLSQEALRARQVKAIEDVEARIKMGGLDESVGKGLITKIKNNPAYSAVPFQQGEVTELINMIDEKIMSGWGDLVDSKDALINLLVHNLLPEPRHFKQWATVYGKDFAVAVNKFIKLSPSVRAQVIDALNLPRALLATLDLSATFRQGLFLALVRPKDVPRAFLRQLKYFASEKMSLEMDDLLRSRPLYRTFVNELGIEFTAVRRGAIPGFKEEPFFSNMAQNIPFVRRSERAFTGYLNEMRMSAAEAAYGAMTAQGATKAQFKLMGDFINFASGRGTLPYRAERFAPLFNIVLFSPRYQASTLGLPIYLGKMLLSGNPYLRRQAALALTTFAGGGAGLLGLLNATGMGKVEIDPRSVDFGKIRFREGTLPNGQPKWSDTRIDIWRGYVQYARFATQMLMGEKKTSYGNLNKEERLNTAMRFAQSKASPLAGLILDLWRGESYMGEPLFNKTTGFIDMVRERLLPLAVQDVIEATEMGGANAIWTAIPATLGIGVLTMVNDLVKVQNKIAREMGYEAWNEIDPKTRRQIENTNVELQVAQISLDRQMMGTDWGDWRLAGKAIENVFKENIGKAVAEYRATGDGYTFREKVNNAYTARRGGMDARDGEERFSDIVKRMKTQDIAEALVSLGPEQLAIRAYYEALFGEDMYDEFGNYKYDVADDRQETLRQQLGQEMFDYIEEYRGLKYEDFPPEYHALKEAQRVLRPYWEVKEDADEYFGKEDSSRKSAFIKRHRDALKRGNPQIQYYLDLFYKRRD